MKKGLSAKFSTNEKLKEALLKTGDAILVDCNPIEKYWSCGLAIDDDWSILCNPGKWPGRNMLGVLLMEVREELKKEKMKK